MNQLYDQSRWQMVNASFNWPALDLVLTAWKGTKDFVKIDTVLANITTRNLAQVLGHSLPVTSKTTASDGTVRTNQVIIPAVPAGQTVTWFTFSKRNATILQSELIYYIDTAETLPFLGNGLDMAINPSWVQAQGWFQP